MDDRTAKRRLVIKVHATKDGQQKLVATTTIDMDLKNRECRKFEFTKSIDKEAWFEMSFKLLAVKGYKQSSVNTSF